MLLLLHRTFVFLSTHSSHDNVGLLRFCFVRGCSDTKPLSPAWVVVLLAGVATGETEAYGEGSMVIVG
jgi:hypothetical protein